MKKIITGMALLLVTTLSAFSQTKNITVLGRVVEDTKEPAIQATVQLLLLPDSVQASGTATTAQGYFTLPKVSAGKYVLKVSYIGFKSQYIPLHLYATTTAKNVGTLTLETDAVMLAEAVRRARQNRRYQALQPDVGCGRTSAADLGQGCGAQFQCR